MRQNVVCNVTTMHFIFIIGIHDVYCLCYCARRLFDSYVF